MARYNAWQNKGLRKAVEALDNDALQLDRGAFFGSIMGTLNHLLWGDLIWMSRFDGGESPENVIAGSVDLTPSVAEWATLRFQTDGRIQLWADGLKSVDLTGELTWFSGSIMADVAKPRSMCVTHFFNHQTHHRGQLHGMLTAAGLSLPATDLVFMPEP